MCKRLHVTRAAYYKWLHRKIPETVAENKFKRNFFAERPNQKWAMDVTEYKWYEGSAVHKLYLSAKLDLYGKSIVRYAVSRHDDNKLAFDTFEKMIQKKPGAHPCSIVTGDSNIRASSFKSNLRYRQWDRPCPVVDTALTTDQPMVSGAS